METITYEKALKQNGFLISPVKGISMLPMLRQATDTVKLVPINRPLKKYDVVLYKRPNGKYVLHRIIRVCGDYLLIRGDNCVDSEKVPNEWIFAVMDGFYRNGRYISCSNKKYMDYSRKVCRIALPRKMLRFPARIVRAAKPCRPQAEIKPEWRYLLILMNAAVMGKKPAENSENADWDKLLKLAELHKIVALLNEAVRKTDAPNKEKWQKYADMALMRDVLFEAERETLFSRLDKAGINYLPLKGIITCGLYPKKGLREYADNDILYDKTKQNELLKIMTELGFDAKNLLMNHDVYQKPPIFNFEMHKELFADNSPYQKLNDVVWTKAEPTGGCGYRMTDEDYYVYVTAHLAKHYLKSGSGLRSFSDEYYIRKALFAKPEFDKKYVYAELKKLKLLDFDKEINALTDILFSENPCDFPDDILAYVMAGNAYGSLVNHVNNGINEKGRIGYFLSRAFMSYSEMKTLYPWLKTRKYLLPVSWVLRLGNCLFDSEKKLRMKNEIKNIVK